MRLRWTPSAADDLEAIYEYLAAYRPDLAQSTVTRVYNTALSLGSMPFRGHHGRTAGTRELVLPNLPYIIVYRTAHETVELVRILHGAQERPAER